jgi:hypothetical protein
MGFPFIAIDLIILRYKNESLLLFYNKIHFFCYRFLQLQCLFIILGQDDLY